MNASGEVVGYASTEANSIHAFLYSGGVMRDLGTLRGSYSQTRAVAINDRGDVVGNDRLSDDRAFVYRGGVMQDLGTLQSGGFSAASAIDAKGQIVGSAQLLTGPYPGAIHGFLYANDLMSDMTGFGIPDYYQILPYSINTSGHIVGDAYDLRYTSFRYSAFLYTPASGMVDLNTLLPPKSGWVLTHAYAINDAGQIIGAGTYQNESTPFLLTMEPAVRPSPRPGFPRPRDGDEPKQGPISSILQR